ncbi:MAG: hypothetical protein ACPIOQ_78150, partial [Promethearchaeia archaeon]
FEASYRPPPARLISQGGPVPDLGSNLPALHCFRADFAAMSSFPRAGGLGVRQVPAAAPDAGDAAGGCLQVCMERLFDLVFAHTLPGVNETVKASFKTPLETLQYLQSLVGVVLDR